ncbi:reverse transcriptase [Plasmopara halstedii]|uniref:Reverse transcriptase n=1 Tax=Plasmopara halstedii TaxID=4781 RepID=A0A0P1AA52_PLAHL|nr:reverse transcriptase [Plasmopara halstedii]CEG37704.1 reverse transcriptase [Plasmopara halstedii]|eukprot:XP_024574073.1 reverse transcriptase [Plasmopara halstedii]
MASWLSFFAEYNFTVVNRSDKLNVLADALSRRLGYELASLSNIENDVFDMISRAYAEDEQCDLIIKALSLSHMGLHDKLPGRLKSRTYRYALKDGLYHYEVVYGDITRIVVLINDDLKHEIVYKALDTPMAGHFGRVKCHCRVSLFLLTVES